MFHRVGGLSSVATASTCVLPEIYRGGETTTTSDEYTEALRFANESTSDEYTEALHFANESLTPNTN